MKDMNEQEQERIIIDIPTLTEDSELLPFYMTKEAAGADVKAYLDEPLVILPGHSALISTGIRLAIPDGYEIQIRPRSGLALKHQVTVLNTPGTIDADYRGEIKVILINHGRLEFVVTAGMRIAQLIVAPIIRANFFVASELVATERGAGGFGSTNS
jgi:dUTP pyrophosphatase